MKKSRCGLCHRFYFSNARNQKYCGKKCYKRATNIKTRYGLTPKDLYKLYKKQKGICLICKKEGDIHDLGYNEKGKLVVDHDHDTGEVRGLLCQSCNKGLGLFYDNEQYMKNAIKYLRKVRRKQNEQK